MLPEMEGDISNAGMTCLPWKKNYKNEEKNEKFDKIKKNWKK
jgi:hypothetical protein